MIRYTERLHASVPAALTDAGYDSLLARLLGARGVETPAQAEAFLSPSLSMLGDPFALSGMARAAELICDAVASRRRITIFGDYDVDGVCACAILHETLARHGALVSHYVPSRHDEGYGLSVRALEKLRPGCDLMITVDCGITSIEEARWAADNGLTLIITDHHEPPETLPDCAAIVDPLIDSPKGVSPCGAGVAFKLAQALYGLDEASQSLDLAALATIADLVPLLGENRIIASVGLSALRGSERPGLRALVNAAKLNQRALSAGQVGFQVAPRINAGGRIAHANRNIELLLTQSESRAAELAAELNAENERRQQMQREVFDAAEQSVLSECDFLRERVMMPVGDGWNHGVIGLAASGLVEKYRIPAVVFTRDTTDGSAVCVGSARSIPGVHIQRAMSACADLFTRFGGHSQAAGCTLPADRLPELQSRLNAAIIDQTASDVFIPTERYDAEIALNDISLPTLDRLEALEPHGIGNPAPTFRIRGAKVLSAKACGASRTHLKMLLGQGGHTVDAIGFGQAERIASMPQTIDLLSRGMANEWMGRRSAQCQVLTVAPESPSVLFEARCRREANLFDEALAEAVTEGTAIPDEAIAASRDGLLSQVAGWLRQSHQGTLIVCALCQSALDMAAWLRAAGLDERVDFMFGAPNDPRAFNTLTVLPDFSTMRGHYSRVVLIDGMLRERDAASLRLTCPDTGLWTDDDASERYSQALLVAVPDDSQLRRLYQALRSVPVWKSVADVAAASGLSAAAARIGLEVFSELDFVDFRRVPFEVSLRPSRKRELTDSLIYIRARGLGKTGSIGECARIHEPEKVSV